MEEVYNTYEYDGPVYYFDKVLTDRWPAQTVASSPKKAKSNLAYRYKKQNNLNLQTGIKLSGKLKVIEGGRNQNG